ncbi:MAG: hypothetical protein AAGI22_03660 [Planctomycetota bacterium]
MPEVLAALPAGSVLLAFGALVAATGGRWVGPAGLLAVAIEALRVPATPVEELAAAATVAILLATGLAALSTVGRDTDAGASWRDGAALALAGAALASAQATDLRVLGAGLGGAMVLGGLAVRRDPAAPGASLVARGLGTFSGVLVAVLVAVGATLRVRSGGSFDVEWVGMPFSGDVPASLIALGLVVVPLLPPRWGGPFEPLARGAYRGRGLPFAIAGVVPPLAALAAAVRTFGGSEELGRVAAVAFGLALLTGSVRRGTSPIRLAVTLYVAVAAALACASVASEDASDAAALTLIGLALAGTASTLALAHVERIRAGADEPAGAAAERPFAVQDPALFAFALVVLLSLAVVPGTLVFEGRSLGLRALVVGDEAGQGLGIVLVAAPVAALFCAPLAVRTYFTPLKAGARASLGLVVALGFAAGATVGLGVAPGALAPLLPYGLAGGEGGLGAMNQLQLLIGALLAAVLFAPRVVSGRGPRAASVSSSA